MPPNPSNENPPSFPTYRAVRGKRMALLGGCLALAVVLPDLVFPLIVNILHLCGYVLHIAIACLELSIEHLLEWLLGVSRHTAQIMTAWVGLLALLALLAGLSRKFAPRFRNFAPAMPGSRRR